MMTNSASRRAPSAMPQSAHDFSFSAIHGGTIDLSAYSGQVLLIVNTASACGFTPQYEGLQALHEAYGDKGLTVLGVPSNDFGRQETTSNATISGFCERNFGVQFALTEKQFVKGDGAHPFYKWAKQQVGFAGRPRWNFHKYLIGKDGQMIEWFSSLTAPNSDKVKQAIETAL